MGGICAIAGLESSLGSRLSANLRNYANWEVKPYSRIDSLLGVSTLVVLNIADYDAAGHRQRPVLEDFRKALEDASANGVECVVLLSSAMVYGAWPNNPVPLTEDSALRPDQSLEYARDLAVAEQLLEAWRQGDVNRRAVAPTMSAQHTGALVRALAAGLGTRSAEDDAPAQFLHEDDLVSAIRLVIECGANEVFNVAPDGAIPGDTLRALGSNSRVCFRMPCPNCVGISSADRSRLGCDGTCIPRGWFPMASCAHWAGSRPLPMSRHSLKALSPSGGRCSLLSGNRRFHLG